jgi:hypothetical protein
MSDLRPYRDEIRECLGGIQFADPYAITIQLNVFDEVEAQRVINRFHNRYKRVTGQRRRRANLVAVIERNEFSPAYLLDEPDEYNQKKFDRRKGTGHYHSHIIADRPKGLAFYEWRVRGAIRETERIYARYNQVETMTGSEWKAYITKFRDGNEEIAIWDVN